MAGKRPGRPPKDGIARMPAAVAKREHRASIAGLAARVSVIEDLLLALVDEQRQRRSPVPALPPGGRTMSLLDRREGGNGNGA